jgi:hypothetical protein
VFAQIAFNRRPVFSKTVFIRGVLLLIFFSYFIFMSFHYYIFMLLIFFLFLWTQC